MSESSNIAKKRQVLHEQSRNIVFNVYNYFKKYKTEGNILDILSEATGISKSTVVRIIRKSNSVETEQSGSSSKDNVVRHSPKSTVDNAGEAVLRQVIHNFHITDKQRPTLNAVYNKIQADDTTGFVGKRSSLRKLILKLGFRWKKTTDNRKPLMERSNIRELRSSYIRNVTNYRLQSRPIVYTDETYLYASHTTPYEWVDNSDNGLKCPISKGKRLIIVHAGSEHGFIDNALLIYKSGQKNGDYHDDMNFINYKRWLEKQLIPNLPPKSVVLMDNASYHNVLSVKHPTTNSKKSEMIKWLSERSIIFNENLTKGELYRLVHMHKPSYKNYTIGSIFAKDGHTVLRLPPYHPELNPIEKIWAILKGRVASKNITFKLNDVEELAKEEFGKIAKDEWSHVCRHAVNIEENYIQREHIMDKLTDELIINLDDESDSDFDFSSDAD